MWEVVFLTSVCILAIVLRGFKTPPEYYRFACPCTDQLTNIAFLAVGMYHLFESLESSPFDMNHVDELLHHIQTLKLGPWIHPKQLALSWFYVVTTTIDMKRYVFAALCIATAAGSQTFHKNPMPRTLFYDRLPMVADMVYMLIVHAHMSYYVALVIPAFVLSYIFMEDNTYPYAVFQGATMLTLMHPACGLFYPSVLYILAKVCEYYDHAIYRRLGFSGHSLKHLLAAGAMACIE